MNSNPLISVIIPFYSKDEFLCECIDSVIAQTYRSFEIVIVDDCSPGSTPQELLADYNLSKIKIIRHKSNLGPSAARNTGIEQSTGELILPLDADDTLATTYMEKTLQAICAGGVDGAYTDIQIDGKERYVHSADCTIAGIMEARGGSVTLLYKRTVIEKIGGYKTHLRIGEDKDFWLRALSNGFVFSRVAEPLLTYRQVEGSLSDNIEEATEGMMIALFRENKQLYIDLIDDWFPRRETNFWEQQRFIQKIHGKSNETLETEEAYNALRKERDFIGQNYRDLYKEWEMQLSIFRAWSSKLLVCRQLKATCHHIHNRNHVDLFEEFSRQLRGV